MAIRESSSTGPSKEDGQALEDSFDRRKRDPHYDQIAGEDCAKCKETIVINREGQRCPTCAKPIHQRCADKHLRKCGAPTPPPYR